jgi:hypothetical protein
MAQSVTVAAPAIAPIQLRGTHESMSKPSEAPAMFKLALAMASETRRLTSKSAKGIRRRRPRAE